MVDDYAGYKALFEKGVTELGCWRRDVDSSTLVTKSTTVKKKTA